MLYSSKSSRSCRLFLEIHIVHALPALYVSWWVQGVHMYCNADHSIQRKKKKNNFCTIVFSDILYFFFLQKQGVVEIKHFSRLLCRKWFVPTLIYSCLEMWVGTLSKDDGCDSTLAINMIFFIYGYHTVPLTWPPLQGGGGGTVDTSLFAVLSNTFIWWILVRQLA